MILFNLLENLLGNFSFLIIITSFAFSLKLGILLNLIFKDFQSVKIQQPIFFLLMVLIGAMVVDFAWIFQLSQLIFFPEKYSYLNNFFIRIAWGFTAIQYQALAFFIESLVIKHFHLNLRQCITLVISSIFSLFFFTFGIYNLINGSSSIRWPIEFSVERALSIYGLLFLLPISIIIAGLALKTAKLPRILQQQLKTLILVLLLPHIISDILQLYPFNFSEISKASCFAFVGISTLLLTTAIIYCIYKVIRLRFLNFKQHVQAPSQFNFINDFKNVLEQLSTATTIKELGHITQTLFKEAFHVPFNRTKLYIRDSHADGSFELSRGQTAIETFLRTTSDQTMDYLKYDEILITDELAFSDFYEHTQERRSLLQFLDAINADIFLPIYKNKSIIGYIVIDRFARLNQFYSHSERDEMLVFASYVGNIINLLQNRNLEKLILHERELKDELFNKHQEINQYKESIRSFLRTSKQKEIGIIFYKNRRFIFGNQAAKEMIKININTQQGHPLSKALHTIARQVEDYKASQLLFTKDSENNKIVLSGVPNLEQNNVIITVYYPEISDIVKKQIDLLQDPTKWDYLLYLETTKTGQLINQLIPGSGESLLNFKLELLKTALCKKATLLAIPTDDVIDMVELLHHISLRNSLHILTLQGPSTNHDIAIKLFGVNPIFGNQEKTKPLLEKLDGGTLFIQNIHFLDIQTQEYLAEFIRYGYFRVFKSEQKIFSSIRIICSTNQNLYSLMQEGTFSPTLFNELKKTTLNMPSLLTLPEQELKELAYGFTQQAIATEDFKNLLQLTEREKNKFTVDRPVSLKELKNKIQKLLVNKSKKNQIFQETQFDPAYGISDPELIHASRLGKQALKDPIMMAKLWDKFKNQNKIATFLGVNRSSVNRRCKEYNLH